MGFSLSVIVHDFDIFRAGACPAKADAILIIDADAMLSHSLAFQSFQSIAGRDPEIAQAHCDPQLPQLTPCNGSNVYESFDLLAGRKSLRV
jgi:hypothetical protein